VLVADGHARVLAPEVGVDLEPDLEPAGETGP
jgi:hypothetical protein